MEPTITITPAEARFVLAAFRAWENEARPDEPHGTYSDNFRALDLKIRTFVKENPS